MATTRNECPACGTSVGLFIDDSPYCAAHDHQPGNLVHDLYHDWIVGQGHSLDPRMVWATHISSGYRTLLLRTDLTPGPMPEDAEALWYAMNDGWVR